jgi:murein DD-endopeptidase MepM/ murein hydrolase activator NlpD
MVTCRLAAPHGEGKELRLFVKRLQLGLVVLALLGAQQIAGLSRAVAQVCDPSVTICTDPTPTPDPSPTVDPTPTPDPSPTVDPTPTDSPTPDPSPTATPTDSPTPDPTATADPTPTVDPTATQSPSGGSGTSAPSRERQLAQETATLEGCSWGTVTASSGAGLTAPPPPYVLAEPPGMSGPQDTRRVEGILAAWKGPARMPTGRAFLQLAGPFPVAGPAFWSNDWHAYRPCPYPHLHQGLDIFAAGGTPAVAAEDGYVSQVVNNAISGLGVEITDRSGIQYFYAHFERYAAGLHPGQQVRQGQVVGYVGNTGDAAGGATHLHFEIQPGGRAMPPKPLVDRWLLVMERRAGVLVAKGRKALAKEKTEEAKVSVMGLLQTEAVVPVAARVASAHSPLPLAPLGGAAGATVALGAAALWVLRRRRSARATDEPDGSGAARLERMVASIQGEAVVPEPTASEDDSPPDGAPIPKSPTASIGVGLLGLLVIVLMIAPGAGGLRRG